MRHPADTSDFYTHCDGYAYRTSGEKWVMDTKSEKIFQTNVWCTAPRVQLGVNEGTRGDRNVEGVIRRKKKRKYVY